MAIIRISVRCKSGSVATATNQESGIRDKPGGRDCVQREGKRGGRSTARGGAARVRAAEGPGAVPRSPLKGPYGKGKGACRPPSPCPGVVPRTPKPRTSTSLRSDGVCVAAGRRTSLRSGGDSLSRIRSGALAPLPPQKFGRVRRSGGGRGAAAPGRTPLPRPSPRESGKRLRRLPRGLGQRRRGNASASAEEKNAKRRPSTGVTGERLPSGRQRNNSHCFC